MNIRENLVNELERLIILREKYRHATRQDRARIIRDHVLECQLMNNLAAINDVIATAKTALAEDSVPELAKALRLAEEIHDA